MKLSSGYPLSLIKHGLLFSYPKLERDIKTDVARFGRWNFGRIGGSLSYPGRDRLYTRRVQERLAWVAPVQALPYYNTR
jgi:hypothetical protein